MDFADAQPADVGIAAGHRADQHGIGLFCLLQDVGHDGRHLYLTGDLSYSRHRAAAGRLVPGGKHHGIGSGRHDYHRARTGDQRRAAAQAAVHPPSIEIIAPVIERAMSPARYSASAAISSTVTNCLVGWAVSSTSLITCSRVRPRAATV